MAAARLLTRGRIVAMMMQKATMRERRGRWRESTNRSRSCANHGRDVAKALSTLSRRT